MTRSDGSNAVLRAVALPTALILVLLAAIVAEILVFSTSRSDELALVRQYQRVNVALEQSVLSVMTDQEASTYWDDAVVKTRQRPLDLEWIDNNLGVWFHTYYNFDEAYLLDQRDAPIYAMQNGRRMPPSAFTRVQMPALELARRLRLKMAISYLSTQSDQGQTVGATEIAVVGGRPAIVSVKPIISETGNVDQAPGSEYLHVAVRYLDGSFLMRMARLYGIEAPRFTWTEPKAPAIALHQSDGRTLGYVTWTPFEPGKQVAEHMIPVLLLALLVIGALMTFLLLRILRSRSELEASRADAQRLAFHDSLTGLPNRSLFDDRLKQALSRRTGNAAVLLLDLDRFKHINDTLGHQAGDELIREFGRRLKSLTRDFDTIARLGGDEFAILVQDLQRGDIRQLAKRIVDDVRRPFAVAGAEAHVGVSIGIAISPECGNDTQELVRKADIALYSAKDAGRNCYRLFSPEMDDSVKLRGTIEEELRQAVATGQGLCLHYQPQVGNDGVVHGVEALLRWEHDDRGLIAPQDFVPVAEETGLIVPLGEWVMREACKASVRWAGLFVAINLSPVQFRSPAFFEKLMCILEETGADARSIQLEVTERVLLDDDDSIRLILAGLRSAGFKIVLDDFGTGYSSLSYLRKFEVDKIKIDGSFVQHIVDSADSRAIVAAILALGQALRLMVAAEGVETAEQREFLKLAGCNEMQGHLFAPALPADEIASLLDRRRSSSAAA